MAKQVEDPRTRAGQLLSLLEKESSFERIRGQVKVKKEDTDALVHALLLVSQSLKEARSSSSTNQPPDSYVDAGTSSETENPNLRPRKFLDTVCESTKERTGPCTDPECEKEHPQDCTDFNKCQPRRNPDCPHWHTFIPLSVHISNQEQIRKKRKEADKTAKSKPGLRPSQGNGNRRRKSELSERRPAPRRADPRPPLRPTLTQWMPPSDSRRRHQPRAQQPLPQHEKQQQQQQRQFQWHQSSQRHPPGPPRITSMGPPPPAVESAWPPLPPTQDQVFYQKLRAALAVLTSAL